MKKSPKLAIVQSLDEMDQLQMEEVLSYIKGLLDRPHREQASKTQALREIRQALHQVAGVKPAL